MHRGPRCAPAAGIQHLFDLLERPRCAALPCRRRSCHLAVLRSCFSTAARSASASSVWIVSMSEIGSTLPGDVHDVVVVEAAHDVRDRVGLADVGEELVAEALALRRAAPRGPRCRRTRPSREGPSPASRSRRAARAAGRAPRRCRRWARWCRTDSSPPRCPALVSALNRVDLPTFGSPTMPHLRLMVSCFRAAAPWCLRVERGHRPFAIARRARPDGERRGRWPPRWLALLAPRRVQHVVDDLLLRIAESRGCPMPMRSRQKSAVPSCALMSFSPLCPPRRRRT